jgi:glycosyltransferase involved in cell wall biosynthesis
MGSYENDHVLAMPMTDKDSVDRSPITLVHVTTVPSTVLAFLHGQIEFMQSRSFDVTVVSSPGPELDEVAKRFNVPVHGVPMARRPSPLRDFTALIRLSRLFLRIRPDIVHASTPKAGALGMAAAGLAGVPVRIYTVRGLMHEIGSGPLKYVLRALERLTCRLADRVVVVSRSAAELLRKEGLCPDPKITVIGHGSSNGVDARDRFNPALTERDAVVRIRRDLGIPDDVLVLGFVGRLVRAKGICELLQAWQLLREHRPEARLVIIGPSEHADGMPPELREDLESDPGVYLVGEVPNDRMPYYYANMDVVVLPSHREGLPNVPLEAAAMGVPVVTTNVTGCTDAVEDGVTGSIVPLGDVHALAEAILRYLNDSELRRQHGAAARERVSLHFRPETIWQGLYEEYERLLEQKAIFRLNSCTHETHLYRRSKSEKMVS